MTCICGGLNLLVCFAPGAVICVIALLRDSIRNPNSEKLNKRTLGKHDCQIEHYVYTRMMGTGLDGKELRLRQYLK